MFRFLFDNLRWLGAGFILTFASGFGQTWFISLFAGAIKEDFHLTDGNWGILYTVATLASAALMFSRGSVVDSVRLSHLATAMTVIFAGAGLGMAFGHSIWTLGLTLFALRFCGQGMFSHMAMTAMGRWFDAQRGKAVSIANLGHPAGEVVLPFLVVLAIAALGWRSTWMIVSMVLVVGIMPALFFLLRDGRNPRGTSRAEELPGLGGRQWQRRDAIRHWLMPALLPVLLTPGFIGTVVFFHQVHVAEVKSWALVDMAPGYSAYAVATVASAFAAGWAADRFGPHRILPVLLVPMGLGIAIIGPAEHVSAWYLSLGVIGITQGLSSSLWGVFLPFVYGTRHLGAVRSLVTTIMVISTAIGPGITGLLIDWGFDFTVQSLFMSGWCLSLSLFCFLIERKLTREITSLA